MPDRGKVIERINDAIDYGVCVELFMDILALLKEQEAAYQGTEELLRQKTMLFDDAIKRLKEQDAEILQLRLALNIAKGTCKGIRAEGR